LLTGRLVFADSHRHGRCHQHRFGPFSEWSEPDNIGPVINSDTNWIAAIAIRGLRSETMGWSSSSPQADPVDWELLISGTRREQLP
jgi:hypothetical protein